MSDDSVSDISVESPSFSFESASDGFSVRDFIDGIGMAVDTAIDNALGLFQECSTSMCAPRYEPSQPVHAHTDYYGISIPAPWNNSF